MAESITESLAIALAPVVQAKVNELGWGEGGDNTDLAEYIILMLNTGKDQTSIAHELATDLLGLPSDSPDVHSFVAWLFQQVEQLQAQANGTTVPSSSAPGNDNQASSDMGLAGMLSTGTASHTEMDTDMGGAPPSAEEINAPRGPRSMRNPNQRGGNKRNMIGQINRAMDRPHDSIIHRVRGNERINASSRGPPSGPRGSHQNTNRIPRNANGRAANIAQGIAAHGLNGANMHITGPPHPQGPPGMNGPINNMNGPPGPWMMQGHPAAPPQQDQQQQMQMVAMIEQQSRLIQQLHHQQQKMMSNNQHSGRGGFKNGSFRGRGAHQSNGRHNNDRQKQDHIIKSGAPEGEDVDMTQLKPEETVCKYNLRCTNKDCKFAHQSPAAPPGITIDVQDVCSFGAACKNKKCVGRHPSPATKVAHQGEQNCKFYPNCQNPHCQFRHPPPPCRNGGDCTAPNCKFTHLETMCKFRPCTNRFCKFKHEEGQRGTFQDKVWVAGQSEKDGEGGSQTSISERKFVDESLGEEMVIPGDQSNAEALEIS
ncbi:hypothetical protein MKZ38_007138 [Zalerion maritima]|uniref:Nab2-like CCCH zinc finger domain-containing protein n=1 Tax=Zalerion maritima TaxID=339359 RepID=A0AAD5RV52_9PEZI|nr:hypothetical protein MKZ38_007138 [Zalerion maritima]